MEKNKKISYRNLIILIVAIILLIIIGITITMARYKSNGQIETSAEIAFFVVEEGFQAGNIMLEDLYPREEPYEYEFTVANTDGTITSETSIDYTIDMTITTNLPLEIKIYRKTTNDNTYRELNNIDIIENQIQLDQTGQTYVRKIKIKDGSFIFNQSRTDTYKLSATFPIEYNNIEEFEGMIDNVAITVDAKQKI